MLNVAWNPHVGSSALESAWGELCSCTREGALLSLWLSECRAIQLHGPLEQSLPASPRMHCLPAHGVRPHRGHVKMISGQTVLGFSRDLRIRWRRGSVIQGHRNGQKERRKIKGTLLWIIRSPTGHHVLFIAVQTILISCLCKCLAEFILFLFHSLTMSSTRHWEGAWENGWVDGRF